MIRSCTSGPKFFPSNWCGSSSVDESSSCHEDLVLPSTDDPEYNDEFPDEVRPGLPVTDEAFEAMLQGFDQDALEADPGSPELLLHDEVEAPLDHDEDEGEEEEPLGEETKARRDLKAEATSLRHLLTHLPKNPHCVSCQQAKNQTTILQQGCVQERNRSVRRNHYM